MHVRHTISLLPSGSHTLVARLYPDLLGLEEPAHSEADPNVPLGLGRIGKGRSRYQEGLPLEGQVGLPIALPVKGNEMSPPNRYKPQLWGKQDCEVPTHQQASPGRYRRKSKDSANQTGQKSDTDIAR